MLGVFQSHNFFRLCDYVRGIFLTILISFRKKKKKTSRLMGSMLGVK